MNIKLTCEDLGTVCDICKNVPNGFDNTHKLTLRNINLSICDECLDDLELEISSRYEY